MSPAIDPLRRLVAGFHPRSVRAIRSVAAGVILFTALWACDARRTINEPVEACVAYVDLLEHCFGAQMKTSVAPSFASPPTDPEARTRWALQCDEQSRRLRSHCH
jgi:hypothetical protein